MKNQTVKDTLVGLMKQVRDDIEDGKLDQALTRCKRPKSCAFFESCFYRKTILSSAFRKVEQSQKL